MLDRKKIIKGLKCCQYLSKTRCNECPYIYKNLSYSTNYCTTDLAIDALELLKEQEERIKKFELERSWDENPDTMGKGGGEMTENDYFIFGMLVGFALTATGFILGALLV